MNMNKYEKIETNKIFKDETNCLEDYLERAEKVGIRLTIVGASPFPTKPTYIPFCNETWTRQARYSGLSILGTLGFEHDLLNSLKSRERGEKDYKKSNLGGQFESPKLLFESLLRLGIVFMNASYDVIIIKEEGEKDKSLPITSKKRYKDYLEYARKLNKPLLESAKAIIYCGQGKKAVLIDESIINDHTELAIHPAVVNKNTRKAEWDEWWSKDKILEDYLGNCLLKSKH